MALDKKAWGEFIKGCFLFIVFFFEDKWRQFDNLIEWCQYDWESLTLKSDLKAIRHINQ
jgi:hypothetical protein